MLVTKTEPILCVIKIKLIFAKHKNQVNFGKLNYKIKLVFILVTKTKLIFAAYMHKTESIFASKLVDF